MRLSGSRFWTSRSLGLTKNDSSEYVHDGWGIATEPGLEGNAIEAGTTTNMDNIAKEHSQRRLAAHGTAVGLSGGLMGNSEVGHLNIGAGRVLWQDIVRIDVAIKKKTFNKNETILANRCLHFMALETFVHFFGDGRDTAPRSAAGYCQELLDFVNMGSWRLVERYYAMDRDKRWERVKIAVDGLVGGEGAKLSEGKGVVDEIKAKYEKDVTDEFLKPIITATPSSSATIAPTCMRELVTVLGLPEKSMEVTVPKDLHITTMSRYNTEFPVAFPPQTMTNVLAEWLAGRGVEQAHVAGANTHTLFFFNSGVEKQFEGEEGFMIPSPKEGVATYDLQPEMSVQAVADKVASIVKGKEYDFVMVGHPGKCDAAVSAIAHTDVAVEIVYESRRTAGYILLITANHGNAEQMRDAKTGTPHTAHTCNPVPFILAGNKADGYALVQDEEKKKNKEKEGDGGEEEEGTLCDVAPTVLDLIGLPKTEEMARRSLLAKKPEGK
ncbi:metalloenzyme [Mycena albidolilacea]|uniref:phosphoglycerate mutase (2,3-diphosphoglycerate-independent) n=1 Tax=Mycena albidolilacea TaxID=1033008 RepID=A0AAD7EG44_9AGAR|nr:metalloenzyme [Mycena albidolilacea]